MMEISPRSVFYIERSDPGDDPAAGTEISEAQMMNPSVAKSLDDRPITAITVIEDLQKCPKDFNVISKTYDMDLDADLWKDNSFFTKKITRYLCVSKEKSIIDYVLEDVKIISDKELPPEGYGAISKTADTDQKAWRKKQLCFKLSRRNICHAVITDVILLNNKTRKAPEGFHLKGDLNGLLLCVRLRPAATVFDNITPTANFNGHTTENIGAAGNVSNLTGEEDGYEQLVMKPIRPAPVVPLSPNSFSNSSYQGLQGVPFVLNSRLEATTRTLLASLPEITIKTKEDIEKEYSYDFSTERELCPF